MKIDRSLFFQSHFDERLAYFHKRLWAAYINKKNICAQLCAPSSSENRGRIEEKFIFLNEANRFEINSSAIFIERRTRHEGEAVGHLRFMPLNREIFTTIRTAWRIMEKIDRTAALCTDLYVQRLVLVTCPSLISATSPKFLGTVILAPKPHWQPLDYIEHMVHEASHIDLYLRQIIDPMITRETELKSPFRRKHRPTVAVFHAAFVLNRIVLIFKKLKNNFFDTSLQRRNISLSLDRNQVMLRDAVNTLNAQGSLTAMGQMILRNIETDLNSGI